MKKALKFILSFISVIIILVVSVPIILSMLLQVSVIQNFAVDKVTEMLSAKAKTKMSISHIDIEFFSKVVIDDVYIEDQRGDSMIYLNKLRVGIDGINFLNGKISLGVVDIKKGECNLYKDSLGVMNVQHVFDNFKPEIPDPNPPNFQMTVREVNLNDFHFSLDDYTVEPQQYGVNFKQMEFNKIHFQARNVNIFNYDVRLAIEHLTFRDRSGFYLQHLSSAQCGVNETGMRFERLRMETQSSVLQFGHLYLLYDNWYAYNDFVNKVTIDADIKLSRLSYRTLSYFTRQPDKIPTVIEIAGRVRGAIPNLHGYLSDVSTQNTNMRVSFSVMGLPDINRTRFTIALDNLVTNAHDIETLYGEFSGGKNLGNVSPILERSGTIGVNGTFEGLLKEFKATAHVTTKQGMLDASLKVLPDSLRSVNFIGQLRTAGYELGQSLSVKDLGRIAFDANVNIAISGNKDASIITTAKVANLGFAGYNFSGISIDGKFVGKTYEGSVISDDPNCDFSANGFFDLTQAIPAYNFEMDLHNANLAALGLNKRDSISLLTAKFAATGTGTKLDDINGTTSIDRIQYINHLDTVRTGAIKILSENSDSTKSMTMLSDFADIQLSGTNSYSEIFRYLGQAFQRYVPSFPDAEAVVKGEQSKKLVSIQPPVKRYTPGSYQLDATIKMANNVASIFVPGLEISEGTRLEFLFDPLLDKFRLVLNSDFIGLGRESLKKLDLKSYNSADSILFRMTAKVCEAAGLYLPNFVVSGIVQNNKLEVGVDFDNPLDGTNAKLRTLTSIYRTAEDMPQIKVALSPTVISLEDRKWNIAPSSVLLDSTGVTINNFMVENDEQLLAVNGRLGDKQRDSLAVHVVNFDVAPLSLLTEPLGYRFSGRINGDAKGYSLFKNMNFNALFKFSDLKINDYSLGNPRFFSKWDADNKLIKLGVESDNGTIPVYGYFDVPHSKFEVHIKFPTFDMALIEPLVKGILIDTHGVAAVDLTLSSGVAMPSLDGTIDIENYRVKVGYTKAEYALSGRVDVKNSCFEAKGLPLTDNNAGSGTLAEAYLRTKFFKDLDFGVNINFKNLLALNTTISDNDIFYGKAYGTGNFKISGNERSTSMVIVAETALSSEFYLPFTGVANIEEASFITFVDPFRKKETQEQQGYRNSFRKIVNTITYTNDLDIKISLRVLPNTKAQISLVNQYMGNKIDGRGDGQFNMHINPNQEIFTMNGSYDITKGGYKLSLGTIFDKQFMINAGSTIAWTGDPADPEVNVDAAYKVKTSMVPLGYDNTVTVNCGINLTGKLFSPQMQLSITAPGADPETRNLLRNTLNTEEAVSNQFFSLFLAGSFMPDMGAAAMGSMSGSLAGATGFEFLSNQLSNLISSDKYNIKVGYRPRTEYTSDEFNFDFETEIIPNKLSLELGGNYNTGNGQEYRNTPFSGDAYLTWWLNKTGTLKLKGFTRVIERFDETQGLQESGLGVYFRQDFQTLTELKQKWKAWRESLKQHRLDKKIK